MSVLLPFVALFAIIGAAVSVAMVFVHALGDPAHWWRAGRALLFAFGCGTAVVAILGGQG